MQRPEPNEYPTFYKGYVDTITGSDLLSILPQVNQTTLQMLAGLPEEKWDYRYAEGKWSIKEVISHLADSERIFVNRALRFARNDTTPLPGFEQNDYVPQSNASQRSLTDIVNEFAAIRSATIPLFQSFTKEMWNRSGIASGGEITVRAIGFVIAGHEQHHQNILEERYLD
ncbi:MAG: DinB family protein [Cyclobacteriaceae bacterium]